MPTGSSHPSSPDAATPTESANALEDLGLVVLKDDQNLIIQSESQEAMAHAAQCLQELWRNQAPDVAVEHFTGDQRLALLGHINRGIAQRGLEQAMQTPPRTEPPQQIALITHAEHLPASDVQMLQDITRHLPGLRWRWVLISLAPSPSETAAVMDPASAVTSAAALAMTPSPPNDTAETAAWRDPNDAPSPLLPPEAISRPSAFTSSSHWMGLGLTAFLVLAAWGTWHLFGDARRSPARGAERAAAVPAPAAAPAAQTTPQAATQAVSQAAPAASDSASEPAKPDTPVPIQAPASAANPSASQPTVPTPTPAPADTHVEVPDIAQRGVRWLAQQSPEFFVLEHGAFQTAAQAQSLIRSRDELTNARVLLLKKAATGGRFLVITGPFRTQERAQNYKVRENLPPQIQVRQVADVLQDSVRTTTSRP